MDKLNSEDTKVLGNFMIAMRNKLEMNTDKVHWSQCNITFLMEGLDRNFDDLTQALINGDKEDVIKSCADIANYAMMIADNVGRR